MPGPEQIANQIEQQIQATGIDSSAQLYREVNDILTAQGAGAITNGYKDIAASLAAADVNNDEDDYLPSIILSSFGEGTVLAARYGNDGYTAAELREIISKADEFSPVQVLAATAFLDRFDGVAGTVLQAHRRLGQYFDTQTNSATVDDVEMWTTGTYGTETDWREEMSFRPDVENALVVTSSASMAGESPALQAMAGGGFASFEQINADLVNFEAGNLDLTPAQVSALEFLQDQSAMIGQHDMHTTVQANSHWVPGSFPGTGTWVGGISLDSLKTFSERIGTSRDIALAVHEDIVNAGVGQSVVDHVPAAQISDTNPLPNGGHVSLDANNKPLEINYPNGEFTVFTRDSSGGVTSIRSSDGIFAYSQTAAGWVREGNPPEPVNAPTVNDDGSYDVTYTEGVQVLTERHRIDGTTVTTNSNNQVVRVVHSNATNSEVVVRMDQFGNVNAIELIDNGLREYINPAQQPTIDATTGVLTYVDANGRRITVLADGTRQVGATDATADAAAESASVGPVGTNHDIAAGLNSFRSTGAFLWRDIADADGTFKTVEEIDALIARYRADSRAGVALTALRGLYPGIATQNVAAFMNANLRTNPGDVIAEVTSGGGPSAVIAAALHRNPTSAEIAEIMRLNGYTDSSQWVSMAMGQRIVIPASIAAPPPPAA